MTEKKDYEELLKHLENQYKNMMLAKEQDECLIEYCKKKISEFPVEDKTADPMPDELKDILPKQ